jgi:selenobiotic family peptide radical SAM maturase
MSFLAILKELGISSSIMLTLTRDNMEQVIPLAERLEGLVDHFTFNRLSPVGEGAALALPEPAAYREFLTRCVDAAQRLSVLGYKDNLINVELNKRGLTLFDGCTGYGCGAAFNFVAVLPDGEVHACRKYPSPVGSLRSHTLEEVYTGESAARYRRRPEGCRSCGLVAGCGGCRAITSGCGLDEDRDVDPFCVDGPVPRSVAT